MKRASLGVEAQWVVRLEFAFLRSKLGLKKVEGDVEGSSTNAKTVDTKLCRTGAKKLKL